MIKPLEYYFADGSHVAFDKYTIDTNGIIWNKKTGKMLNATKMGKYNVTTVYDNSGKPRSIRVCRAVVSTFEGRPLTRDHTADHMDRNPNNDTRENIQWLCNKGQGENRIMPETFKSAFIVVKNGIENTVNGWLEYLQGHENAFGREYTSVMIKKYAQKKHHGFSYKEYPDLPEEVWKEIPGSKTSRGDYWEISNMNRVKYITKYAKNVLSGEQLSLENGYPRIVVGKCHILSFMAFFPNEYNRKKPWEMILHEGDNRLDFRPHKLHLGTRSENSVDAHNNGKYDGKKSERMKCASYIDDVLEKEHDSQSDAARYLKSIGYNKAQESGIGKALKAHKEGKVSTRYERTWKLI